MFPNLSNNNCPDSLLVDSKYFGHFRVSHKFRLKQFSNFKNILFGKFCLGVFLSANSMLPIFRNFIGHVFALRTNKQMRRPNARRVIAMVEYAQTFWNCTEVHFPRKSVGSFISALVGQLSIFVGLGADPNPTTFSFLDFVPEFFHSCLIAQNGLLWRIHV
jgi:hypothetical protein